MKLETAQAAELVKRLIANVARAFVGKDEVVESAALTLIAGGHALL